MRYLALLLIGSFGAALLFVAYNRFQAVNGQLASLNTAAGVVESIGPDGDLHVKYTVGSTDYEILRSVPVKVPWIRTGDAVPLVFSSDRPDAARIRQWSVVYQDSAVTGAFGLAAILAAIVVFLIMGSSGLGRVTATANATPSPAESTAMAAAVSTDKPIEMDKPIELRNTGKDFVTTLIMAAGIFVVAFLLYRYPYFLWSRWLSYPAAGLVAIVGAFVVWGAFFTKSIRIRADENGVVVTDSDGGHKFLWKDVATLKRETVTQVVQHKSLIDHHSRKLDYSYTQSEIGHYLILLDASGKELLKLDEDTPMTPLPDWDRLRAYIPQRTGLPVQQHSRESPLGVVQGF
jgi:hypothetical protein